MSQTAGAEWEEGSDPCLTFFVNSAWDELSEWREFLEEHFPDLVFCYQAEELGCGVFTTNSPDVFEDKYVLISTQHGTDYFSSVEVLCEAVKDAVKGSNPKSLRQCREAVDSVEDVYLFECANVGF